MALAEPVQFVADPPVKRVWIGSTSYEGSEGVFDLPLRPGTHQVVRLESVSGISVDFDLAEVPDLLTTHQVTVEYSGIAYLLYRHRALYLLALLPFGALAAGVWLFHRSRSEQNQAVALQHQLTAPLDVNPNYPLVGQTLGEYRLEAPLGQGGMATVYRGLGPDGRAAAVKVISLETENSEFRTRFEREIKVSCTLKHPNVVEVLNWGQDQDRVYLVLELIDGQSLRDLLPPQGFPLDRAMELSEALCAALQYAHERGVVHRDLKPDNIMVTHQGVLKLMDFGLARDHQVQTVTLTGQALGTPNYMPPEQFLEKASKITLNPRSDQYSLAITIYELLSGVLPLSGDTPIAVITKQLYERPDSLLAHKPELPAALEAVLFKALEKDPQDRYTGIAEFLQALRAAVA